MIIFINRYFLTWFFGGGVLVFILTGGGKFSSDSPMAYVALVAFIALAVVCIMWWRRDKKARTESEAQILIQQIQDSSDAEMWRQQQRQLEEQESRNLLEETTVKDDRAGHSVVAFCGSCGQQVQEGAAFCAACGARVGGSSIDSAPVIAASPTVSATAATPLETRPESEEGTSALYEKIERVIENWNQCFTDLENGREIRRWQNVALEVLMPIALEGYAESNAGIALEAVLSKDDEISQIAPCFFDSDPDSAMVGEDKKAKFRGKPNKGLIILIGSQLAVIEEQQNSTIMPWRSESFDVSVAHEVKPALSSLSGTSAGSAYELLFKDGSRMLFRIALEFKREDSKDRIGFFASWSKVLFESDLKKLISE